MSGAPCVGRECKLGWGYNKSLELLIHVQGQPLNVTSQAVNQWWYLVWDLASDDLLCWAIFLFIY